MTMEPAPDAPRRGAASTPAEAGPSSSSAAARAAYSSQTEQGAQQEGGQRQQQPGLGGGQEAAQEQRQPQPLSQQPPAAGLSRYESQKRRDWNTFLQYLRNHKPPLTLPRCSGTHVIEFLKYLDQFGKTKVHADGCTYFGQPNPPVPCACPLQQAWGSLDALIGRLRAAYEESGGRPESNPCAARAVRIYLREVREAQAKARGIPCKKRKRKRGSAAVPPVAPPPVVTAEAAGTSGDGEEEEDEPSPSTEQLQTTPVSPTPPPRSTSAGSSTVAAAAAAATTTGKEPAEGSAPSSC